MNFRLKQNGIIYIFCFTQRLPSDTNNRRISERNFQENPLSGDGNEIDYFDDDASASFWRDDKSKVTKTATHYSKACQELSKFVPNLCTYAKAKERCSMYCDSGKIQPGRNFSTNKTTLDLSVKYKAKWKNCRNRMILEIYRQLTIQSRIQSFMKELFCENN